MTQSLSTADITAVAVVTRHLGGPGVEATAVGLADLSGGSATTFLGHGTLVTVTVATTL